MTIRIGQKTEYFLSCQSGRGIVTYLNDALRLHERQIILKGGTDQVRSRIIRNVGIELIDRGHNIEIAHGILNPDNLEGIIIPQLDFALVSADQHWEVKYNKKIINLDQYRDNEKYLVYKSKIQDLNEQITVNLELAWEELQQVQLLFMERCAQGSELEERKALYITEKLLETLFTVDEGKINHRFGQILTSRGLVSYLPKLLTNCSTKYYMNGIKYLNGSRILKLVAREAVLKGLVVDVYHNFLDTELIELIILPEADLALAVRPFTDGFQQLIYYEDLQMENGSDKYIENLNLQNALNWFQEIEKLYDQCCIFYHETLDFSEVSKLEKELVEEIIND